MEDWEKICPFTALEVERGVTALVHGQAVAIFRTHDDEVFALGNYDPFAKASVLSRGIVGTRGDVPFVASPMHKHDFRSEEHTSELQSLMRISYAVFCLKKK